MIVQIEVLKAQNAETKLSLVKLTVTPNSPVYTRLFDTVDTLTLMLTGFVKPNRPTK